MKLLVFAHRLEVGGTQHNAIELAVALRDRRDYEIVVFASPGPMTELVRSHGLRYIPAPDVRLHPSPSRMRALRAAVLKERPDAIHAWDWWQGLEAYLGVHLSMGTPLVITDMMMSLTNVLPRGLHVTFGVPEICDMAQQAGWRRAELLVPPIDTVANSSDAVPDTDLQRKMDLDGRITLVSVSRLAHQMKSEPLERCIDAVAKIGKTYPVKFIIVGDGQAKPRLERLAAAANRDLGREAVSFTGTMLDPRPAYAAADIVVGMGGSALRGMSFRKPVIVVGAGGFAKIFDPNSLTEFHRKGFYGSSDARSSTQFVSAMETLCLDAELRLELGAFGRNYVVEHHGLDVVSSKLGSILEEAVTRKSPAPEKFGDVMRSGYVYLRQRAFLVASRDAEPQRCPLGSALSCRSNHRSES